MGNLIDSFVRYASQPAGRDKILNFMVMSLSAGVVVILAGLLGAFFLS